MASVTERLELLITASAKGAVTGLKEAETATGSLGQKATGLSGILQKLGIDSQVTGGVAAAGIAGGFAVAGAAVLKFGLDAVDAFVKATAPVREFQHVSGATAQDSSKLVAAMQRLGIESSSGATAMFQLTKRIAEGKDTLDKYGVSVARSSDGNLETVQTLMRVADAYNATADQGQKNALVFENFGRGGAALIPLLEQGSEGLKKFFALAENHHQIFSQDDLNKARDYTRAQRDLNTALQGIALEVGQALIPVMTRFAHAHTTVVEAADKLGQAVGKIDSTTSGVLGKLTNAMNPFAGAASASFDKAGSSATGMGVDFAKAAQQSADLAAKADELAKAEDHLKQVLDASQSGPLALERAQIDYEKAVNDSTDAVNTYGAGSAEARDADLQRREAAVKLGQAQFDQTQTEKDLTASVLTNKGATDATIASIDEAITKYGDSSGALTDLKNHILDIPGYKPVTVEFAFSLVGASPGQLAQAAGLDVPPELRASGDPVTAGKPYIVGEKGPELFLPASSGTIIPNGDGLGSSGDTFHIYTMDSMQSAAEVVRAKRTAQWLAA